MAAVALAFLATGCAAETPAPLATAEATSTASATAGRVPATIEATAPKATPEAEAKPAAKETHYADETPIPFSNMVTPENKYVKPGESVRITGSGWEANSPLQVRLSTTEDLPPQNADGSYPLPDPILIIDLFLINADADGRIDFPLAIPAGTQYQTANLSVLTPSGTLEGTRQASGEILSIGVRGEMPPVGQR